LLKKEYILTPCIFKFLKILLWEFCKSCALSRN